MNPSLKRCNECRQYLDDELVTVNPIKGANPEYITLTNPDLNIYEEDSSAMTDERVQHKITGFRYKTFDIVICEHNSRLRHHCCLDHLSACLSDNSRYMFGTVPLVL